MPDPQQYSIADSLNQGQVDDTIYGIKNESLIPIRKTELVIQPSNQEKVLFDPTPISNHVDAWQIILLLLSVTLVGMVKAFSNNRYNLGLKALVNYSVAQEITREEQVLFHRSNVLLSIAHLITFSLFIYQVNKSWLSIGKNAGFVDFAIIILVVLALYVLKYLSAVILLFVFNDRGTASVYIFNVSLFNNLLGVLLIPILCLCYFTTLSFPDILSYIVLPVLFLVLMFRLIRLFAIGKSIGLLYVYIFLYICTFEILPLVVLYRFFVRY